MRTKKPWSSKAVSQPSNIRKAKITAQDLHVQSLPFRSWRPNQQGRARGSQPLRLDPCSPLATAPEVAILVVSPTRELALQIGREAA